MDCVTSLDRGQEVKERWRGRIRMEASKGRPNRLSFQNTKKTTGERKKRRRRRWRTSEATGVWMLFKDQKVGSQCECARGPAIRRDLHSDVLGGRKVS